MPSSTIFFCDIVGFSKLPVDRQSAIVNRLTEKTVDYIKKWLNPPTGQSEVIGLPTGDGLALAFLEYERPSWSFRDVLGVGILLTQFGKRENLQLRMGLHIGRVEVVNDVNGNRNVCGDAINMAQRVMGAANDGQVLLSRDFIRQHIGEDGTEAIKYDSQCFTLTTRRAVQVYVKHSRVIEVVPVALHDEQGQPVPGWDGSTPDATGILPVRLTPLPIDPAVRTPKEESFVDRLAKAQSIALVQLTGERLLSQIESGDIQFSEKLEQLWVFMPHIDTVSIYEDSALISQLQNLEDYINRWRTSLMQIKEQRPQARVKLGLFKGPAFFGGSFLDWEQTGGQVHISPYVWNVPARDCPGFDLERRGRRPHPVLGAYIQGLRALHESTTNELKDNV